MKNTKLILENSSLTECITGVLTGLYTYDNINNIRIVNKKYPEYLIIPIEINVIQNIVELLSEELKEYEPQNVTIDQLISDFIVIKQTKVGSKLTIETMSLFELIAISETIPDFEWNISEDIFNCYEIITNETQEEFIVKTDMQ